MEQITDLEPIKVKDLSELLPDPGPKERPADLKGLWWKEKPKHNYLMAGNSITSKMPSYMKSTKYSPEGCYEEDCDWCLPVICNLKEFNRLTQEAALQIFYHWHPEKFRRYFKREPIESEYFNSSCFEQLNNA